jgi:hypothetical protein
VAQAITRFAAAYADQNERAPTSPSWTPSPQDGSPPNPACDIGIGPPGERAR